MNDNLDCPTPAGCLGMDGAANHTAGADLGVCVVLWRPMLRVLGWGMHGGTKRGWGQAAGVGQTGLSYSNK